MPFSFVQDVFSHYDTDIRFENDIETLYIRNEPFKNAIIIQHFPNNHYTYRLQFATQHYDTSSKETLIEHALAFANAQKASIEFFENGNDRFGGTIIVALIYYMQLRIALQTWGITFPLLIPS